jgi:hypothetical protein
MPAGTESSEMAAEKTTSATKWFGNPNAGISESESRGWGQDTGGPSSRVGRNICAVKHRVLLF